MPPPPSPRTPATAGDPLRAFRDRAAVILAEERGFTPQSRVKLARIANELGLSDAQAEEAMRSLKADARPKATDPIVEKFRQRLHKDLSGRQKTVIGPEIEARVVESAKRKYGLDAPTVRQVLAEVAAELKLRHITGDQAVQLYVDMVDQAVGDATWLAREAWDRLRSAGEKWGLSFEEADDLVEQKIAANRRASAAGRLWNRLIIGGSLAAVALVLVTLGVIYVKSRQPPETAAVDGAPGSAASVEPERKRPPPQPAWWDVDLAVAMATARREITDVAGLYDDLKSEDGSTRRKAYEGLVDLAVKIDPDHPQRQTVIDLVSGCHALDPDEACAQSLRQGLLDLVPDPGQGLSRSTTTYQRAYFGVETALTLLSRQGMPLARGQALAAAISSAVGTRVAAVGSAEEESLRAALAALTKTLYRHLTTKGPLQPDEAATLQRYLSGQATLWLTAAEIERLNATFLVAMLTGAEKAWKTFEPLMRDLVDSRDPLIVLELLHAYRQVENRPLQQALGALLVRRTGAKPRSDDPRQVARAVRQALGAAGVAVANSAEDRWEDLKAAAEPVLTRSPASPADRAATLAETVELAGLATQAMALAQGEPGFAIFDELARAADADAGEKEEPGFTEAGADGGGFRRPPVRKRPLSLQEKQALARSIGQLADFANQPPFVRANALRIVAARVPLATDLTYEQATIVARYLLAAKSDEELESALGAIEQLRSWKQVRLAVADRLSESKLTPRQRDQVLDALAGSSMSATGATPDKLRQLLLADVLADLDAGDDVPAADRTERLPAIAALAEAYRQRARVLAVPAAEYQAASSPAAALEMVVRVLARRADSLRSAAGSAGGPLPTHKLEAARYLAANEPQRTVLLQRLLLEVMAQRIAVHQPREAAAAAKILADLAAADAAAGDLLAQLGSGERATLEMGMLYAVR